MSEDWAAERETVLNTFNKMLAAVTGDGSKKRQAGAKPPWWRDGSHWPALFTHAAAYERGEFVDKDSKVHTLIHMAWRALAIAYIESNGGLRSISKVCPSCNYEKPIGEFVRGSKTSWFGRGSYCKSCHAKKNRAAKFGKTIEELDAILYHQGNRCAICHRQRKPDSKEFAVDHDHITGEVRGVLCGECNAGLEMFGDNIATLVEAIQYLTRHTPEDGGKSTVHGGIDPAKEMSNV